MTLTSSHLSKKTDSNSDRQHTYRLKAMGQRHRNCPGKDNCCNCSDKIEPLGNQPGQHLHRPKGGPIPWRSGSLSHIYIFYDPAPPLSPLEKNPLPWKSCPHAHHPICIYPNLLHHGSHIQRKCFQRATTSMPVYYHRL